MSNQVVLITGALAGIGRETALAFAREGARLIVSGRNNEKGMALVRELEELATEAEFVVTDVRLEADVAAVVQRAVDRFGRLDVAVNNAGTEGVAGPITDDTARLEPTILDVRHGGHDSLHPRRSSSIAGAQAAHDLVGSRNVLVNGAALSIFAITSGIVGFSFKAIASHRTIIVGAVLSASAMGLLVLAVVRQDLLIFLGANATAGAGYALLFRGGLELINSVTAAANRGGVLSSIYLCAYLSLGSVALLLGAIARFWNFGLAVNVGAGFIIALSAITMALITTDGRK